ncbi:DUF3040 domain-containing protein [Corynebacterium sp. H113]|uniref:DUF3040 domain-containing protein n=1 Tax=Corynebacterium sp. H113 TaxID=3133419 RepID=UPI0030A63F8F
MGLSEQEQRMLDEIESALYAEDPKFGSTMSGHVRSFDAPSAPRGFSLQVIALIGVGLVLLIGGVAGAMVNLWLISISVLGFLLMFGAGVWALMGQSGSDSVSRSAKLGGARKTKSGRGSSAARGDSSNLESRFRDRFNGR